MSSPSAAAGDDESNPKGDRWDVDKDEGRSWKMMKKDGKKNCKYGSDNNDDEEDDESVSKEEMILVLFLETLRNFARRKRFMFILGLALGALLMVYEDPVSYCAAKRMLWTREALLRVDPICATHSEGSFIPGRVTRGLESLTRTIATTMPESLRFNLSEVQRRVSAMEQLVDFMPSISFNTERVYSSDKLPGLNLANEGLRAKHPVIMIPGVITTGLELWRGQPCAAKYFRQRVWGTFSSLEMFLLNPQCWLRHMVLDESTGLDPEGIKIRAALGFEAADYVIGGYWVWAKLVENLAEIGYTHLNMELMGYDWRLSFCNLEKRDRFFTRLKRTIENQVDINGEKVVAVTHSMGGNVFFYFMHWVEAQEKGWMDRHIESFAAVGVPFVGIPSALTRLLTGVIREFSELGVVISGLMDLHMKTEDRRQMMRSWGSLYSLLPKGGEEIWNQHDHFLPPMEEHEQDDSDLAKSSSIEDESFNETDANTFAQFSDFAAMDTEDMMEQLLGLEDDPYIAMYKSQNSYGSVPPLNVTPAEWTNPLQAPLPTSKMKIYCLYGYGKDTERAYHYTKATATSMFKDDEKSCSFDQSSSHTSDDERQECGVEFSEKLAAEGNDKYRMGINLQEGHYAIDTAYIMKEGATEFGMEFDTLTAMVRFH
eukprot:CAMPEP_0114524524 /NCGR_PEP_ID=MMETSP0109-20121206/21905_1 /TAXON_ID=29199 /ORGANISM="Chlorarachnion reptans, Strain CCCM449" /LENGTH=654 /DNA_ID=CAMNT_0001705981 /DNA_START=200 /DNA_END=2168 /DNA_ORIENTATION=-